MAQLASVGDFCPNPECAVYGDTEANAIIHHGKTRQGRQRFQCKVCKKTFNERHGTLFYNRKTDEKDILECLALLAEGVRIASISRGKGIKEDAILSFLREAAQHTEQVESMLLNEYRIAQAQIDGLWTYVGRKEAKKSAERRMRRMRRMRQANTGAAP
jgi:transposase-like protein